MPGRGGDAAGSSGTFLTELGLESYETLDRYSVSSTSQSTLLLQKKKKMQEVQMELDRKKREHDQRVKKCMEKERELQEKQDQIKESVVRFDKFVKENDAKCTRALKKERDEAHSRMQKEAEIEALKSTLESQARTKEHSLRKLQRLNVYEEYLESVVEHATSISRYEFQEVDDLLTRHLTLTQSIEDQQEVVETRNTDIEELRFSLAQYIKEKEDEILVATSDIAGQQKLSEQLKYDNAKFEQRLTKREAQYNDKKRKLGEAKMAIANIYQRCRKGSRALRAPEDTNDLTRVLDYICQRLLDLQAITKMGEEQGLVQMPDQSKR